MKIHQLTGYIQSIYLVEYQDKLLLLDGCCRADVPMLKAFITQDLIRSFSDLKLVVVTHMHPDHAGAAHKLRELTGCKIASALKPNQWYSGMTGRFMHLVDIGLATWVSSRLGKPRQNLWFSPTLKPDYELTDKELIPGFSDWQVLTTDGHTDRDLSVLHMPSKRIYIADLMVQVKKRFIAPIPVYFPERYRASVSKVRALKPNSVMLAHGGEVSLTENDYDHLLTVAPRKRFTIWTPVKNKFKRLVQSKRR